MSDILMGATNQVVRFLLIFTLVALVVFMIYVMTSGKSTTSLPFFSESPPEESNTVADNVTKKGLIGPKDKITPVRLAQPPPPPDVNWSEMGFQLLELEKQRATTLTLLMQKLPPMPENEDSAAAPATLDMPASTHLLANNSNRFPEEAEEVTVRWSNVARQMLALEKYRAEAVRRVASHQAPAIEPADMQPVTDTRLPLSPLTSSMQAIPEGNNTLNSLGVAGNNALIRLTPEMSTDSTDSTTTAKTDDSNGIFINSPFSMLDGQKTGRGTLLVMSDIWFETGQARLLSGALHHLGIIADYILQTSPTRQIRIEGHTDNQGNDAYNLRLSLARAESVRDVLIQHGISAERIQAQGHGKALPVATNTTEAGRQKNRRVEIIILDEGVVSP